MSDTAPKINAFTAPTPPKSEENKIDQFKKYRIIIPLLFVASVIIGVGGYFYYRNSTLQSLQQQEDTFASIPSGLEISPTSGNWNIPQKLKVKNVSDSQKTVTWFLDCWDEKICQDTVGQNVLQPGEAFEQGLGHICSKWQLDLTTKSVNPPWTSPNDIPDNFEWEWGGTAEKKNDCNQTPSPTPTPSASLTATPSSTRSPSPTPTRSASPTATATSSPSPSTTPPIGGPSETPAPTTPPPTSTPEPSSTSTPGPSNSPSEVANATTTPGSTNPPTQVANAEQLPKAGVEDYASYIIGLGFFSVVVSVLLSKLRKKLY